METLPYNDAVSLRLEAGIERASGIGINSDVDVATVPEDCWGGSGLFPWINTPTNLEFVSTSAQDGVGGTGARSVQYQLLNSNGDAVTSNFATNGITAVPIPFTCSANNGGRVMLVGSNETNVGDIILRDAGGGTVRGIILAGQGVMNQAPYTVPTGCTLIIKQVFINVRPVTKTSSEYASMKTWFKGATIGAVMPLNLGTTSAQPYPHTIDPPIALPERTRFSMRIVEVSDNGTVVTVGWNGMLRFNK